MMVMNRDLVSDGDFKKPERVSLLPRPRYEIRPSVMLDVTLRTARQPQI